MKSKVVVVAVLFLCCGLLLWFMAISSKKTTYHQDVFARKFLPRALSRQLVRELDSKNYYIAGATSQNIYLGDRALPLSLLIVNRKHGHVESRRITYEGTDIYQATQITIDSSRFYVADLVSHHFLTGAVSDFVGRRSLYDSAFFAEAVPLSDHSFVIRTLVHSKEFVLAKEMRNAPYIIQAPGLLQKQVDGIFCTDGMLHYNADLRFLVYVYFYRNQFICADTSMNLLYRGTTIDTISRTKLRVVEVEDKKMKVQGAPPLIVNRTSAVSGKYLFINSNMMSKNEDKTVFESSSVVDVYNLFNGRYVFSFYIPFYAGRKMNTFRVFGNEVVAIHEGYLVTYAFNNESGD